MCVFVFVYACVCVEPEDAAECLPQLLFTFKHGLVLNQDLSDEARLAGQQV